MAHYLAQMAGCNGEAFAIQGVKLQNLMPANVLSPIGMVRNFNVFGRSLLLLATGR